MWLRWYNMPYRVKTWYNQRLILGLLRYPDAWPQCSQTVYCGPPPESTINGTRVWLNGLEGQDTYDTNIR